jgi:hypothetical protein
MGALHRRNKNGYRQFVKWRNFAQYNSTANLLNLRAIARIRSRSEQYQRSTWLPVTDEHLDCATGPTPALAKTPLNRLEQLKQRPEAVGGGGAETDRYGIGNDFIDATTRLTKNYLLHTFSPNAKIPTAGSKSPGVLMRSASSHAEPRRLSAANLRTETMQGFRTHAAPRPVVPVGQPPVAQYAGSAPTTD